MGAKLVDISNQRFGRLVALSYMGKPTFKWVCKCDCGNDHNTTGSKLRGGAVKSCGCLDRERLIERNTSHGLSHLPEYGAYNKMKARCAGHGENAHYYTERGITVCDTWLNGDGINSGFELFMMDMGERPSREHSIDRIDNDLGYFPGNCRWATKVQQSRNRRGRHTVTYDGRRMPLSEAADLAGIPYDVVLDRVGKLGWTVEDALSKKSVGRWK